MRYSETSVNISIIISIVCIVLASAFDDVSQFGITRFTGIETDRLSYMFFHGGALHLLINIYSLLSLSFIRHTRPVHIIAAFIIAVTIPQCLLSFTPTVGLSTMIYALTGLVIMESQRWTGLLFINLAIVIASVALPHIAFASHLYCLAVGASIGFLTGNRYGNGKGDRLHPDSR